MGKILKNKYTFILIFISIIFTRFFPDNWSDSFNVAVPTIIGVLVGTMFTTVVFILSIIINRDIVGLDSEDRILLEKNFKLIKSHLLLLVSLLVLSFFAGYWSNLIFLICPHFITLYIGEQDISVFIQIFSLLLAAFSVVEMILVVFLYFEIRWDLLKKQIDNSREENKVKSIYPTVHKEK